MNGLIHQSRIQLSQQGRESSRLITKMYYDGKLFFCSVKELQMLKPYSMHQETTNVPFESAELNQNQIWVNVFNTTL